MQKPILLDKLRPTGRRRGWLLAGLLLCSPAAFAQLSGTYTINNALPTGGTNYTSFAAAATALGAGVSGPVTFNVSGGPYTEQLLLNQFAGSSATNRVTFNGNGRTIQFGSSNSSQRAVITLNGADFVTINNLVVDATVGGTSSATYGYGIQLLNSSNNDVISNCIVTTSTTSTSSNFAGIVSSASATAPTTSGPTASQNLTLSGNTITGGYYSIAAVGSGSTTAPTPGIVLRNNELRDFYLYGLYASYLSSPQIIGNDISRPARSSVSTFYGLYLTTAVGGASIEKNRLHAPFGAAPGSTSTAYCLYLTTGTAATASNPNEVINNALYDLDGSGAVYAFYNTSSNNVRYYHNTVDMDASIMSSSSSYGLYQTTGTGVEFRDNIVRMNRGGSGTSYAIYVSSTTGSLVSNYNDLVGSGANFKTGYYTPTAYTTLPNWRTANGGAYDQNSVALDPQFVGVASGNLAPTNSLLNNLGTPLARVTDDITGAPRGAMPDMGAFEFTPVTDDVDVVSIDGPVTPAAPGSNPVLVTIRNGGTTALNSVTLSYALNGGTPVTQTFTGLSLATGATRQLTFTVGVLAPSGSNTLTVTGSLPNGNPDGNASNNSQTVTFVQPTPSNDEPCAAVALGTAVLTGSNSGSSTSLPPGIVTPACSPSTLPKDVWFTFTPTLNAATVTLTGAPAGMLRVFSAPSCSAGPFTQVFCRSSGANNTAVGAVAVTGLTPGNQYYLAVSGYGSVDTPGSFTIQQAPLVINSSRASRSSEALTVFPNPSSTGQLTLRVASLRGAGTAELLNALGQPVRQQALSGSAEHQLSTSGLAAGVYTLRVQGGGKVLTQKVVLQ